ncbi:hypothetical protein FHX52_1085 [Humibacillus xanthopallidus]|uniref:Uncharacterized protein n=1 Tax=Humibacillus xanthopallidus TaxID=412689 RepID=A0A543PV63_9MICO|nr:hypothetical protein [Humibacillus xanthopallidus]TQN47964.1 hypothetical protein FHX52_1085 [Humibacillus xanthopallidus]
MSFRLRPRRCAPCSLPTRTYRSAELEARLVHDLNDLGIDYLAGSAVMLHAAGLSGRGGEVIALVATSGTGKTTAAAQLAATGATGGPFGYVTDETVAVLADGRVPPFPKPLAVIDDPDRTAVKSLLGPDRLGLLPCPDELSLHAVVLLQRDPTHDGSPLLAPVATVDAVLELVGHTSALLRLERPLRRLAEVASRGAGCFTATYAEAHTLGAPLRKLLLHKAARAEPPSWSALPDRPSAGESPEGRGRIVRADVVDGIRDGSEGLVLVGESPVHLGPLALTLWYAAGPGATDATLLDAARRTHGDHPGAERAVRAAVDHLIEVGVLRRT